MSIVADGALVYLRDESNTDWGSWPAGEQANCPWCDKYLHIELSDGELMSPQEFLNGKDE
jgi:hypothetical protein